MTTEEEDRLAVIRQTLMNLAGMEDYYAAEIKKLDDEAKRITEWQARLRAERDSIMRYGINLREIRV